MSLSYSYIEQDAPKGIPPRALNGGLYTGTPFEPNAPWGNLPAVPEAHVLVAEKLKSANPPPDAIHHIPGYTRVGNNTQFFPNHTQYKKEYHLMTHS